MAEQHRPEYHPGLLDGRFPTYELENKLCNEVRTKLRPSVSVCTTRCSEFTSHEMNEMRQAAYTDFCRTPFV